MRTSLSVRGIVRLLAAIVGGLGIASVLWLAGLSVLRSSVRVGEVEATGLPLHCAALFFAPGYDGFTIAGSAFFGSLKDQGLYFETASSVAIVTTVLALFALVVSRRRHVVIGLLAMGIAAALLSFRLGSISPVQRLVIDLGGGSIVLSRSLALLGFAVSVLGALGAEIVCARHAERLVRRALSGPVVIVALRSLERRISDAIYRQLLIDAQRAQHRTNVGSGGQTGNDSKASVTDSHPAGRLFGKATPEPAITLNRALTPKRGKDSLCAAAVAN